MCVVGAEDEGAVDEAAVDGIESRARSGCPSNPWLRTMLLLA